MAMREPGLPEQAPSAAVGVVNATGGVPEAAPDRPAPGRETFSADRQPPAEAGARHEDALRQAGPPVERERSRLPARAGEPAEAFHQAPPTGEPAAEAFSKAVPQVQPRPATVADAEAPGARSEATPGEPASTREATQPEEEPHAVSEAPARPPRRRVIYHAYRPPVRRFVYYRHYYPRSPSAILAQVVNNVRRNLDAIFH
jgi:hypothetical protein